MLHKPSYPAAFLVLACLVLHPFPLQAQTDSLKMLAPVNGSLRNARPDSLRWVPMTPKGTGDHEAAGFYDTLRVRAARNPLTRRLVEILFISPSNQPGQETDPNRQSRTYFSSYSGMVIRSVSLKKLDPFGSNVNDTLYAGHGWLGEALNTIHLNTRNRIIRNNLVFKKNDPLDPMLLAENERILRSLSFIADARILVSRAGVDSVDLVVITKDVFSLGFDLKLGDLNEGSANIFDRNFLGLGHEWENHFLWDGDRNTKTGYEGIYRVNNILGSFVHARLDYFNAFSVKKYGLELDRNFITPRTKYAGGLEVSYHHDHLPLDTLGGSTAVEYTYQDYWLGRSFLINPADRSRLVIAGRYLFNHVFDGPDIPRTTFYKYHTRNFLLGSLSFSRENFFTGKLIYNYGRTEDISFGTLVELTGGLEINEFNTRGYTAVQVAGGRDIPGFGYLATSLAAGGFVREGMFEQALFKLKANYFTPLLLLGQYRVRNFINLDYTLGIRRFQDESINVGNDYGIRGLSSDSLSGTRRLAQNKIL